MTNTSFLRNKALWRCAFALAACFTASSSVWASTGPAQQFQQWADDHWVSRQVSLAGLGFVRPTVLTGSDEQNEIYLPVPKGVPLQDATLQFNAKYLRADGGRTSMTLAIDGYPVAARRLNDVEGDVSQAVGIDGMPRDSGFVRFGVRWSSVVAEMICSDQRAPGNSLQVAPDSRFSYRYDRNAIKTLATAWGALPPDPVLLVASGRLSQAAYNIAWRTGVTLERAGKRMQVRALPAVGTLVNLSKVTVPASLRSIPAFAALASGEAQHRIKNDAECGALIALGSQGPVRADLVVDDQALRAGLRQALDALGVEVRTAAPDAAGAYSAWQKSASPLLGQLPGKDQVLLSALAGNPVIAIGGDMGKKVAGLFGNAWRALAQGSAVTIDTAKTLQKKDDGIVLLSQFGGTVGTLDVINRADRTMTFDIRALGANGSLPAEIVFDVSAAPNTAGDAPVAAIFLNDYLLGAEHLRADGKPQRISAAIPRYSLADRNQIRIAFLRQPTQLHCHDKPTAFPVSVLPSSHLRLKKMKLGNDFVGMAGRFAGDSSVLVPASWLSNIASLQLVIRIADATGVSPEHAALQLVKVGEESKPTNPFLAFDTRLADLKSALAEQGDRLIFSTEDRSPLLSLNGLDHTATVEVVSANGETGVLYRTVGKTPPTLEQPFHLAHGNIAVLGDNGLDLQLNSRDPNGSKLAEEGNPQSLWEKYMTFWLVIVGLVAFVLIAARVVQVKRRKAGDRH